MEPKKLIKGMFVKTGENPFVLKAIFVCRAYEQNWTKDEINAVLNEAEQNCYDGFIAVLRKYCKKYNNG
nr:hypothetical protein [Acinetobacter sp. Marseille-Q1620]